jgi:Poly(ADP-ribose) polymerase catalytic domain
LLVNQEAELRLYHPLDVEYNLLSCQIKKMEEESKLNELIVQAVANTHADSHSQFEVEVNNIYTLEKASEKMRFLPFEAGLHNKFLLWHGVQ